MDWSPLCLHVTSHDPPHAGTQQAPDQVNMRTQLFGDHHRRHEAQNRAAMAKLLEEMHQGLMVCGQRFDFFCREDMVDIKAMGDTGGSELS